MLKLKTYFNYNLRTIRIVVMTVLLMRVTDINDNLVIHSQEIFPHFIININYIELHHNY